MKKIVITVTLFIVICIVIVGNIFVNFGLANPNPRPAGPTITAWYTPEYSTNSIVLKIDLSVYHDTNDCIREVWYSLDEQTNVSIPIISVEMITVSGYPFSEVKGQIKMPMWSQGAHTLKVSAKYTYSDFILAESKTLYIGQAEPIQRPIFTIISPQNQTTYTNQIPIIYSVNSTVVWSYYALDVDEPKSVDWKVFTGNLTLTNLSIGSHKLIISVKTDPMPPSGLLFEQTISFNVILSSLSLLIIASISTVTIVSVSLLIYFKKHKEGVVKKL